MSLRSSLFPTQLFVALLVVSGCTANRAAPGSVLPASAAAALEREAPGVSWDPASLVRADFNYDGVADLAVGGRRGERYVVGIVAGPERERAWALEFGTDGGQDSLCSARARLAVEKVTEEAFVGAGRLRRGSRGIALSDDECDAFHIYWDPKQERFAWWRL